MSNITLPVSGEIIIFSEKDFLKQITTSMEAELKDSLQEFIEIDKTTNKPTITNMKGMVEAQRSQRNKLIKLAFPNIDFKTLALKDLFVLEEIMKKSDPTGDEKFVKTQERNKMLQAKYGEYVINLPETSLERLANKLPKFDEMDEDELIKFVAKMGEIKADPKA